MSRLGTVHHTEKTFTDSTGTPSRIVIDKKETYNPSYVARLQAYADNAVKLATERQTIIEKAKSEILKIVGL